MKNTINHEISQALLDHMNLRIHSEIDTSKDIRPLNDKLCSNNKLLNSVKEAIEKSGLKDGMTISFHHHFRNGDYIVNMVMEQIAQMGIKNLRVASSSLSAVHAPLIDHIKNGVITRIESSGMRGELAEAISHGLMEEPVVFRSHGGRAAAIANGKLHIDVAFLGTASADVLGNASGIYTNPEGTSICGSLGYAKVDARYANKTIILTDNVVKYPNLPASIEATDVDYVVKVDAVGDSSKISSGATRFTKNPRDLLIAEAAATVIEHSGFFNDGFSIQTGSGGAALAVTRFITEEMEARNIKARYALGGITAQIVNLHKKGLIEKILDVQSFDTVAAESLRDDQEHIEIDGCLYASLFNEGSAIHQLDIVILSALEVDINFNVNVLTGSDGVIRGAIGGHPDTAGKAALTVLVAPLIRGRIPCIMNKVNTLVTPGTVCDVLVTDMGIAVNPNRPEIKEKLINAGIEITTIEKLQDTATKIVGIPEPLKFTDKIVGIVTHPDGTVLDVIHEVQDVD